jgi:hypothetical protein
VTTDISIDHESGSCRVVTGAVRQTFRTTPRAVGIALLGMDRAETDLGSNMSWQDHLASHGVLVGTRRKQVATLLVIPRKERTVRVPKMNSRGEWEGAHDQLVSFPPVLLGLLTDDGAYRSACLFMIDVGRQSTFSVISTTPVLHPWPYGNIYMESGAVCWGQVNHSGIHTIKDLEELFFGSGFNRDLFSATAGVRLVQAGVMPDIDVEHYTWTFPRAIDGLLSRGRS